MSQDYRTMSQSPQAGVSGTSTTLINEDLDLGVQPGDQFRRTKEREVEPSGGSDSHQPVPVPVLQQGQRPSSLTDILGKNPTSAQASKDIGFGPRMVVLQAYVTGPRPVKDGHNRPAYMRGRVIWLSQLLGDELTEKALDGDPEAIAHVRRYTDGVNPAIREANSTEALYSQVTFVEGEQQLGSALAQTQSRVIEVENENSRMKKIIEGLGLDANASEQEIEAMLAKFRTQENQGQQKPIGEGLDATSEVIQPGSQGGLSNPDPNPKGAGEVPQAGQPLPGTTHENASATATTDVVDPAKF